MSDLKELYQEVILDHGRRPRNFGDLPGANRAAAGHNPLCGDKIRLLVQVEDDTIVDARFQGDGCAISKAAASMMTGAVKGMSLAEVDALFSRYHNMITGEDAEPTQDEIGKLVVFAGVKEFPARVKCASLAWHTLRAALQQAPEPVTTE